MNATRIVAPAIAGLLIATWGIDAAYYTQATMYLLVLWFMLRLPPSTSHLEGAERRGTIIKEIGAGLRYIGGHRTLRMLMLMAFVPTVLGMPYMSLLPGFAVTELGRGAGDFGFMFTMSGIGAIVGSVFIAMMTAFSRKALLQVGLGFGYGGALVALGLSAEAFGYAGALGALLLLGLFSSTYQTLNNTMVMGETKPEFYGRVMSVYMLTWSVFPLMAGPMGVLADRITATATFMVAGAGIVGFIVLCLVVNPKYAFRRSEVEEVPRTPPVAPAPSGRPASSVAPVAAPTGNGTAAYSNGAVAANGTLESAGKSSRPRRVRRRDYMGQGTTGTRRDYMALPSNGANGLGGSNGVYGLEPARRRTEGYGLEVGHASNGAIGANGHASNGDDSAAAPEPAFGLPLQGEGGAEAFGPASGRGDDLETGEPERVSQAVEAGDASGAAG
jgi:hypothetical protein